MKCIRCISEEITNNESVQLFKNLLNCNGLEKSRISGQEWKPINSEIDIRVCVVTFLGGM